MFPSSWWRFNQILKRYSLIMRNRLQWRCQSYKSHTPRNASILSHSRQARKHSIASAKSYRTHKWQARHQEFTAWIDVQMTSPNAQSQNVLREFYSRFTGSLRDWFIEFERKMDEKLCIFPKWGWMSKLRVIFRTKFKELLGKEV